MREEPQQGPWADTMHGGPWTRHGHPIPGLTVLAEIRPRNVYRCGGVRMCRTCQADAEAARGLAVVECVQCGVQWSGELPASCPTCADR